MLIARMAFVPSLKFLNGKDFCPFVGLGTIQSETEIKDAVRTAIRLGYRHFDCAMLYQNEELIGEVLEEMMSPENGVVARQELFISSKIWATHMKGPKVFESCLKSIEDLKCGYLDLLMIHTPFSLKEGDDLFPKEDGNEDRYALGDEDFLATWIALETLIDEGTIRFIGLSNFNTKQIHRLLEWPDLRYRPVCNEIEVSPFYSNYKLVNYCQHKDIHVIAYSPFGAPKRPWVQKEDPVLLEEPILKKIGVFHQKTPAQVVLRWCVQRGCAVVPKSSNPKHLEENLQVFDFALTAREMSEIDALNINKKAVPLDSARHSAEYPFDDDIDPEEAPNENINNLIRLC